MVFPVTLNRHVFVSEPTVPEAKFLTFKFQLFSNGCVVEGAGDRSLGCPDVHTVLPSFSLATTASTRSPRATATRSMRLCTGLVAVGEVTFNRLPSPFHVQERCTLVGVQFAGQCCAAVTPLCIT